MQALWNATLRTTARAPQLRRKSLPAQGKRVGVLFVLLLGVLFSLGFPQGSPAAPGDPEDVLLLPLTLYAEEQQRPFLQKGLPTLLASRLSGEGLHVMPGPPLDALLTEEEKANGIQDEARVEELSRQLKADYAVFGSVTTLSGGYSLDLSILDLTKTPPERTRVSEATDENQLIPKLSDVAYRFRAIIEGIDYRSRMAGRSGTPGAGEETTMGLFFRADQGTYDFQPTGYTSMRLGVLAMDTGDLNGDGTAELALLGRDRLVLAVRENETLVLKDTLRPSMGESFLRVSIGDLDRNQKPEIYLVSLYGKRAQTTVYEWDGAFHKVFQESGHLNAVRNADTGADVLLGQDSDLREFFSGGIRIMEYKGPGKLEIRQVLEKLEHAQLYTLALTDLNRDGVPEFIGLGKQSRLTVWDADGNERWQGTRKLGGTNNAVHHGQPPGPGEALPRVEINGRILVTDVDGNGTREVIACDNTPVFEAVRQLRWYNRSKVLAYAAEGTTLSPVWTTRKIKYAISDVQKEGITIYLAGMKGQFSNLSEASSRILWFE